jgi:hypothetical protein
MRFAALFLLLLVALVPGCSCKEPKAYNYKVTGKVVDTMGQPLSGVAVQLNGFDIQQIASVDAVTDADGAFEMNFDINPFDWRQEAHWVFILRKDGFITRSVSYPEFSFDDRFRYQGYWYTVYFRSPVVLKPVGTSTAVEEVPKPE